MSELITAELVLLDADLGNSTSEVIEKLALLGLVPTGANS